MATFKDFILFTVVLPMNPVRTRIRYMFGGYICKITFRRMEYKIRALSNKNSSLWYTGRVRTSRLLLRLWQLKDSAYS